MTAPTARPQVADSVLELIGQTPLVQLKRVIPQGAATVLGKMENLNPGGSVKDRIALAMIEDAERSGRLKPDSTIVEPTSGNTGIGLALVAAVKGYRIILTMPEDMSLERRRLLERYGAELVLTPAIEGMTGSVFAAQQLCKEHPDYFMPQQFENQANPEVHYRTTAKEIMDATGGRIDAFVAGVARAARSPASAGSSANTLGAELRSWRRAFAFAVLSGGRAGMHASRASARASSRECWTVESTMRSCVSRTRTRCSSRTARARRGILAGISAGANVFPLEGRRAPRAGKTVVTIICDTGERYLSVNM